VSEAAEKPDRLVFFSDAVIAIAMTLLAIDLPVPSVPAGQLRTNAGLWNAFANNWSNQYFPFLLSFVVIAAYWRTHHHMFRYVARLGPGVVQLNFAFLLMIVLLPFVTRVLGADGSHQIGVVLYAAAIALVATILGVLALLLRRGGLLTDDAPPDALRYTVRANFLAAAMFAVTIPVAFVDSSLAKWLWLILALAIYFVRAVLRRLRRPARPATLDEG
jgi:uncharacterized membrane protein